MRTTLHIEDDVQDATKEMTRKRHMSTGQVIFRRPCEALATLMGAGCNGPISGMESMDTPANVRTSPLPRGNEGDFSGRALAERLKSPPPPMALP